MTTAAKTNLTLLISTSFLLLSEKVNIQSEQLISIALYQLIDSVACFDCKRYNGIQGSKRKTD